jgi:hypothetical protein
VATEPFRKCGGNSRRFGVYAGAMLAKAAAAAAALLNSAFSVSSSGSDGITALERGNARV